VTATLPIDVQQVFETFVTTELTTVDGRGQPITWPVTPYYRPGGDCISFTTGLGYPKKANDAARNPQVSMLFSDPTGSGLQRAPMVLVQGVASVDDEDLDANRERYIREAAEKLPSGPSEGPPESMRRLFNWYFTRIYVHVRPERVYIWPDGDGSREPELLDSHMEEVRSGHDEEPDVDLPLPEGGKPAWDRRIEELGPAYDTAVLSFVAPDGFPFSVRVPVAADRRTRMVHIEGDMTGAPLQPGLACIAAHAHEENLDWQRNFHVRGDLVEHGDGWALVPHRMVGGFELPSSSLQRLAMNFRKVRRFRKVAKRELAKRGG
jgi:Pyridoxamine 5'-phosphate oxidase